MNGAIREGKGWVRIERSVWSHPVLEDDAPISRREAWLWLIAHAEYEGSGRGEVTVRRADLASIWGWDKRKVRHFLELLEGQGMVSLGTLGQTRGAQCRISLLNYNSFQASVYADARNAPESRPNRARNSYGESDTYPASAPESRPNDARNAPESNCAAPESRPNRARNSYGESDTYPASAPESRPNDARNGDFPPYPPKKEQSNKEQFSSSQGNQDHSAQATPRSSTGGGGAKPLGESLVEFGELRDGVVWIAFRARPPKAILEELKLCGMTYDAGRRMWVGPYSDNLRASVRSLIPCIDTRCWGEDAVPPEPSKPLPARQPEPVASEVDPDACEMLRRWAPSLPGHIIEAARLVSRTDGEVVMHTGDDDAAQLLIARDVDRELMAADGVQRLLVECGRCKPERVEAA